MVSSPYIWGPQTSNSRSAPAVPLPRTSHLFDQHRHGAPGLPKICKRLLRGLNHRRILTHEVRAVRCESDLSDQNRIVDASHDMTFLDVEPVDRLQQ